MRYGSPSRSAHHAPPEGGLALLVGPGPSHESTPTGQHRQPRPQRRATREPQRRAAREPQRRAVREPQRTMQLLLSGLGAVIMSAICGLSGYFVVADERRDHGATATGPPLGDRLTDVAPLTLEEVFPAAKIRLAAGAAPYSIGMTHIDSDCGIAVTGRLGAVLANHACSQVVRAEMTAPYGGYRVTAGIFNLADEAGATQAGEQARDVVESGDGTFSAMGSGGPGMDPLSRPPAQVSWHEHGHYLVYCVIARPDGRIVRDDDRFARRITVDLIQSYLGERVVGRRTPSAENPGLSAAG